MSLALICACLWVLAATLTAFLPLRYQYVPGGLLLLAAPFLIGWLAITQDIGIVLFAIFAVLSLFRRPLLHLARKATGTSPT